MSEPLEIKPGVGIGPLVLGVTQDEVRAILGDPAVALDNITVMPLYDETGEIPRWPPR